MNTMLKFAVMYLSCLFKASESGFTNLKFDSLRKSACKKAKLKTTQTEDGKPVVKTTRCMLIEI